MERLTTLLSTESDARAARRLERTCVGTDTGSGLTPNECYNVIYLDLAPHVALLVTVKDWKKYYHGNPSARIGRCVAARGWLMES